MLKFLSIKDLHDFLCQSNTHIVVWGTGSVGDSVFRTLEAEGLKVSFFGDSDPSAWGGKKNGIEIISPHVASSFPNSIIFIGSFSYLQIYKSLRSCGIKNIFALFDTYKYSYNALRNDREVISRYFSQYDKHQNNRMLLEIYGNIGDTILRAGIVKSFIDHFGTDNVYILVESWKNAEVFTLLTPNVMVLEGERFSTDNSYRVGFLSRLNGFYFCESVILCDIRLYANRRYLNHLNCNIEKISFYDEIPEKGYLLDAEFEFICNHFYWNKSLSPQYVFNDILRMIHIPYDLPRRYVAIHMGASKAIRRYNSKSASKLVRYINRKGYTAVFLGDGYEDETFFKEVVVASGEPLFVKSYVSKLSVIESLVVLFYADFFLGTDSGMWNASYVLGKYSVVLYGGGEYGLFKHRDEKIRYITTENHNCFGCGWYCTNNDENGNAKCIDDITPGMVEPAMDFIMNHITRQEKN